MKKYRARFDSEHFTESLWLTSDDRISTHPKRAFVGSVGELANLIARMVEHHSATVRDGMWTLERKHKGWIAVQ